MYLKTRLWNRVAALFVLLSTTFAVIPVVGDTDFQGKSLIYLVTRDTGTFSSVLVSVNGKIVGAATPASHILIVANPGTTEVGSAGSRRGSISLTVAAGGRYYVAHNIGVSGTPEFRVMTENDGRTAVAQTRKLAEVGSVPLLPSLGTTPRSVAARESEPESGDAPQGAEDKHAVAIILKGGAYRLSHEAQTTGSVPTLFEGKSTSVGGFEVEWRHPKGFSLGGEAFTFRNNWADIIGFVGDATTSTFTVNGKYYLGIGDFVYPYAGVGVGLSASDVSGADGFGTVYEDSVSGIAYQGVVGIEFRFKYVGLNLQYKRLTADLKNTLLDGSTETIKMGGSGQLLGLVLHIPLR